MNLLVAENDFGLVNALKTHFEAENYTVDMTHDTEQSVSMLRRRKYHAAIVDLDLPSTEGIAIFQFVRTAYQELPILILASSADSAERVQALDSGADDVVQKPFAFSELLARVRAVLRRSTRGSQSVLRLESLELDRVQRTVTRAGRIISLTPREFCLLEYLMLRQGRQTSRAQIIEHVWKLSIDTPTNVVDVYINYLRRKIDGREDCKLIHTVRGVGYELHSPASFYGQRARQAGSAGAEAIV
jgi:DNA-binding response OmpR family regulator